ncbi:MSCRAMM family protein [Sorangium sp. So ce204]|uniref:MSCRAMM family protein n=1 Tax=Sorangium sp. So ce204 TaxID=3133288 RepID=UPI003F60DDF7
MPSLLQIQSRVHQAAIAGRVIDQETEQPVAGVHVVITGMPTAFSRELAMAALRHGSAWGSLVERPDRTRTARDGCYRFVDLPDGDYVLSYTVPGGARRYGDATRAFTIARGAEGELAAQLAEVALPPTGVRGIIHGPVQGTPEALPLARVRVAGTGEEAYCDAQGRFYLTGVEVGERALQFSASGFLLATVDVQITKGVIADIGTVLLDAAPV